MGRVEAIFVSREKKSTRIEIEEGMFRENYGLEGDAYSKSGTERQVPVLSLEGRSAVQNEVLDGLCFERFMETLRISGIPLHKTGTGTRFSIGRAVFEVVKDRKKCYPECDIVKSGRVCSLKTDVRFLKVIKSGVVRKGDPVEIILE